VQFQPALEWQGQQVERCQRVEISTGACMARSAGGTARIDAIIQGQPVSGFRRLPTSQDTVTNSSLFGYVCGVTTIIGLTCSAHVANWRTCDGSGKAPAQGLRQYLNGNMCGRCFRNMAFDMKSGSTCPTRCLRRHTLRDISAGNKQQLAMFRRDQFQTIVCTSSSTHWPPFVGFK
jgi:hypothetical protein